MIDWLQVLFSLSIVPVAIFFAPCQCCGADTTPCTGCSGSGNNAPNEVQIVISGITNSTCGDCTNWNGTFIVEWQGESPLGQCNWSLAGTVCAAPTFLLLAVSNGSLTVQIDGTGYVIWHDGTAGLHDCLLWSSHSVPFSLFVGPSCSGTPVCNITSLP